MLKLIYRFGFFLALGYWRLVRPVTLGVCAVVVDDEDRVLLVRNSYRPGWHLPGGGVNRGESALEAIERELQEEVGIVCIDAPQLTAGPLYSQVDHKHDHKFVFLCTNWRKEAHKADPEIEESRFFAKDELPGGVSPGVELRLQEYFESDRSVRSLFANFSWLDSSF